MIGPVVKIDPDALPKHPNIHYLGGKKYSELPDYLAGWDIALLLFARNESTRYISPTKTPEYLAAGKPVISTSIRDVVRPYGELNLVEIADTADDLIRAAEKLLSLENRSEWLRKVDAFLENISWDKTWAHMSRLIDEVIDRRRPAKSASIPLNRVSQRAGVAASTR
jgi:UDP-galactopyranose mutase